MKRPRERLRRPARRGITLLEIVLSLGLIAVAISLLAQLVNIGNRAAQYSRDTSKAQLYCESVMHEIVAGIQPADSIPPTALEIDPAWLYSVEVTTTTSETLSSVRVTVEQLSTSPRAARFSLTQWLPAPTVATEEESSSSTGDAI